MTRSPARIRALDALRGFALLGILVVNVQMFSGWGFLDTDGRQALPGSEYDGSLHALLEAIAHDKFYSLFSLLFGYSFVLMSTKAQDNIVSLHLRRMFSLIVIGLLHGLLLWPWDILFLYGLMGLLLTLFLHCRASTLLGWSAGLLVLTGMLRWQILTGSLQLPWGEFLLDKLGENVPHFSQGNYREVVHANFEIRLGIVADRINELRPIRVLAMFLIGAAAARLKVADPEAPGARLLPAVALVFLPVGLALAVAEHRLDTENPLLVLCETLAGPLMAIAYAAVLLWFFNRAGALARPALWLLSPTGRMALSNYIGQSALCLAIFYGFGFGQFAEFSLLGSLAVAGAVFGTQLLFSRLWLGAFRQGPVEWLWRWVIKGRRPALLTRKSTELRGR